MTSDRTGLELVAGSDLGPATLDPAWRVAAAFLLSCRSPHTRRDYARDLRAFFTWCAQHELDPLAVRRAHIDPYTRHLSQPRLRTG